MSRSVEDLRVIAAAASAELREVYALYELGEAPSVTAGMARAVLAAAGVTAFETMTEYVREVQPRGSVAEVVMASCPPTAMASVPPKPPAAAESSQNGNPDEVERAVIAQLRRLAVDHVMPTQATWDAACGSLPISGDLYHMFRRRQWSRWAELAGLTVAKRGRQKKEPAAAQEGTFRRSSPVSASAAAVLGPEHVVVSPHGSERNGNGPGA